MDQIWNTQFFLLLRFPEKFPQPCLLRFWCLFVKPLWKWCQTQCFICHFLSRLPLPTSLFCTKIVFHSNSQLWPCFIFSHRFSSFAIPGQWSISVNHNAKLITTVHCLLSVTLQVASSLRRTLSAVTGVGLINIWLHRMPKMGQISSHYKCNGY